MLPWRSPIPIGLSSTRWKPESGEGGSTAQNLRILGGSPRQDLRGISPRGRSSLSLLAFLALLVLLSFLEGCSVVPQELRREVDRAVTFSELKENPDLYVGRMVLLGGEIIETRNLQEETELEILQKPLGSGDVPVETDESEGRYLIHHLGYLDPAIYRSGRFMTVVGEVMGGKSLRIGETDYQYPVLAAKFLYLWPKGRRYVGPYYYYPYYYPPYYPYGVFWFHYPYFAWPYWYHDYPYYHKQPRKK